jgi:glutamyl-Q tRNA(Asp) synthetase
MGLLYPCFCTRSVLAQSSQDADPEGNPRYPGTCRVLSEAERRGKIIEGKSFNLRIDMEKACRSLTSSLCFHDLGRAQEIEADPGRWGDVVLVRKDIGTSYHIAVVVDDAIQGVTHVTRGMDLFEATHIHTLLQSLLGLPTPLYHHHELISDQLGRKLSKSARDPPLRALREAGMSPDTIRRSLGFAL